MLRRLGVVGLIACVVVAFGGVAWAHVTIAPDTIVPGASDTEIAFRVPNEQTTATTKLQVFIPPNPPFLGVLAQPIPGWTDAVVTTKLAKPIQTDDGPVTDVVTEVTWTATSAATGIKPGEFGRFEIIVGHIPGAATSVTLKALQTYADGNVVRWIEGPSGTNPAPILTLTAAQSTGSTPATTAATTPSTTPVVGTSADVAKKSDVNNAKTLGLVGIVVGALGLIFGAAGFLINRRPARR